MTTTQYTTAYQEMVDFLAAPHDAEDILGFRPSPSTIARIIYLVEQHRQNRLSVTEEAELTAFLDTALFVHMHKVQAAALHAA